jgi:hypothetical protein
MKAKPQEVAHFIEMGEGCRPNMGVPSPVTISHRGHRVIRWGAVMNFK